MEQELPSWRGHRLCVCTTPCLGLQPRPRVPHAEGVTAMCVAFTLGGGVSVTSAPSMATKEPAATLNTPEGTPGLSVQGASPRASGTAPGTAGERPRWQQPCPARLGATMADPAGSRDCAHGAPSPSPRKGASGALCAPELKQSRDPVMTFLFPFIG